MDEPSPSSSSSTPPTMMPPSRWGTKLTRTFRCRLPIVGAPMAGVAGGALAAETCRAGGLGMIAAGYNESLPQLEEEIRIFRDRAPADAPLSIGFIGFAALRDDAAWERYEHVLRTHRPRVVQCFAPAIMRRGGGMEGDATGVSNVQLAHDCGALYLAQVGSVAEAQEAVDAGVDGLIAQGSEAGGHGLRRDLGNSTLALSTLLVQRYGGSMPIIAAGGIANGQGMAAALAMGCDGVVLGTRLWASRESIGSKAAQEQLLQKTCDDVIRTTVFDQFNNAMSPVQWPHPHDSVGALRNHYTRVWDGRYDDLQQELADTDSRVLQEFKEGQVQADPDRIRVLCGEGVGHIEAIEGAYDIVMRVEQEARDIIRGLSSVLPQD